MMDKLNDEDIIAHLQRGNPNHEVQKAALDLYRHLLPPLWQMVRKRNDRLEKDELEHLIHFTIADLIEQIQTGKYPSSVSLKAYANGMLEKKILNAIRNQKRENQRREMTNWLIDIAVDPTPEQIIISKEKMAQIEACFRQLSQRCRDLIELTMDQKSHEEIAEILACKIASVKVILHRCRKDLFNLIRESNHGS